MIHLLNLINMLIVLILFTGYYAIVTILLNRACTAVFKRDVEVTRLEIQWGLRVITITSILWIFIVPFSYLELLEKVTSAQNREAAQKFIATEETSQKN